MTYLIMQILFCLLIAFLFGFILGWLFGGVSSNKNQITQNYTPPKRATPPAKAPAQQGTYQNNFVPPAPTEAQPPVEAAAPPPPPPPPPPPVSNPVTQEAPPATAFAHSPNEVDLGMEGYEIETLEGVGPKTGIALREVGITTIADFLARAHDASHRAQIANDVAVRPKMVDSWASMADLLRINGVDHQAAELMHKSGIRSVVDLSQQNAGTFIAQMESTNSAGKRTIAPEVPSSSLVTDWITQAGGMQSAIEV